ncbi:MAG: N-6 DNA methylase [Deltaproteobacteria bacterium]|jgi:predicted helicase|nr:N-6 DNA methylase [Deltaproteobacteria bacterium]
MLKSYLKKIAKIANQGDAREESYYASLEELLGNLAHSFGKGKIHITTLPKSTEAGNPDFRVWDGKQHIVGYVEAKAPTVENLDAIEVSEQLKRYRGTFPNLILTNFFEFRLYRDGILVEKALIARPFIAHKLKTIPPLEKESDFTKLMEAFYSFSLPRVYNAKNLAIELAKRTRFLREEVIVEELAEEEKSGKGFILGFYDAFRHFLISGLSKEDFADLYSQTITYGLFAACMRAKNGFNRKLAYDNIPRTIGILRDVFRFVSLEDVPAQMEWIIDDIAEVLSVADVNKLLQEYFKEGKGKDPVVHFYETFLAEYDPKTREKRGVYYTPEPVVSYIVRSLHHILKDRFDKADGMASNTVTVLDPASGTLTFLAEAAKLAVDEFVSKYGEGDKKGFIKEHILKNFYAFELMMAPYAVGHLKMSFLLEELGYKLQEDDRFKLYLTNTLDMEELEQTNLPGMASLSEESRLAGKVKKEQPILVILGNPPYSGHSANRSDKDVEFNKGGRYTTHYQIEEDAGSYKLVSQTKEAKRKIAKKQKTWIGGLIEYYKILDGKWLKEKNSKWLQDDYVKFIRFGQWKIDQAGEGAMGFITNHSYLDNPTFRGMRESLMNSFNEIYLLDLHGNSLKKEECLDGSKDENVFDIRQGTAIALFIKTKVKNNKKDGEVHYSEIWGLRKGKYDWLINNNITTTKWQIIAPKSEFYLFVPRDERLLKLYEKSPKITDIFLVNSVGIVTARDKLTIQFTPEKVWTTILNFSKMDEDLARQAYSLGKDARDWKVNLAQKDLIDTGLDKRKIIPILYRPFDIRYTYYTGKSRGFHCMPRPNVMRHMMHENLGLITNRQVNCGFKHILCTNFIINDCTVSLETRERSYMFPLHLYPDPDQNDLFSHLKESKERKPNINEKIFSALSETYKTKPKPEDIFYYIYAVFYSNTYREKYTEFLKTDFPRVPFTRDKRLFKKLAEYGKRLADLHLMRSPELDSPVAKFQGSGDKRVDKIKHDKGERVYINKDQYFEGLEENIWGYRIGGYQVCHKWLKDRKGRILSLDDVKHYCRVATAIQHTINIQKSTDETYNEAEKNLIGF